MKQGFDGFLCIHCWNYLFLNRVPFESTQKVGKSKGMSNFSVNKKIETGIIYFRWYKSVKYIDFGNQVWEMTNKRCFWSLIVLTFSSS